MNSVWRDGRRRGRLFLVLGLLLALGLASSARAQGTSGTVPDPISTADLMEYADALKLSSEQVSAIQTLHDEYKREFRELRDGEIAEFMKQVRSMQGSGMMPQRDNLKRTLEQSEAIERRIAEVDNRLFDRMGPVLTPPQVAALPRVKLARHRDRLSAQQMMWITGQQPADLSKLVRKIDLTADEQAAVDAVLAPYETRLTSDMEKLHSLTSRMMLDVFDAMEKSGLSQVNFENAEEAQKHMEAVQTIWRDMTARAQEAAGEVNQLNARTARSIAALLQPGSARAFRLRHHAMTYPESGMHPQPVDDAFSRALKAEDLTDAERQAIEAAQTDFLSKSASLMDESASLIDEFRKSHRMYDWDQQSWETHHKALSELQTRSHRLSEAAYASINAAMGEQRAQKHIHGAPGDEAQAMAKHALVAAEAGDDPELNAEQTDQDLDALQWGADQFLPPRLSARDLKDAFAMLQADADQRVTVQQLHKEYVDRWSQLEREGDIHKLQQAMQKLWQVEDGQVQRGPSAAQLDEVYRLRRAALAEIVAVDKAFFDDVELAVLRPDQAPRLARVRQMRERATYNRGEMMMWASDGSQEPALDLSRLVRRARLAEDQLATVDPVLVEYENVIGPLIRARYDASLTFMRAQEQWNVDAQAVAAEQPMDMGKRYRELLEAPSQALSEANQAICKQNRDSLDKLVAALPAPEAHALRRQYQRLAYPSIYTDPLAVDRHLADSLRLGDLTDEQRRRIDDLSAEYRPAYDQFCEQMLAQVEPGTNFMRMFGGDPQDWKKMQERQEASERLRFDRTELNQRAIATLRATLTEDQLKRLGGLPQADEESSHFMWR